MARVKEVKLIDNDIEKKRLTLTLLSPEAIEEDALMSAILIPEEGEEHGSEAEDKTVLRERMR